MTRGDKSDKDNELHVISEDRGWQEQDQEGLQRKDWPTSGLTKQDARWPLKVWSRQAWLHAMHVLISSSRPCAA